MFLFDVQKNIGYTDLGIGPLPSDPQRRRRLGEIIDFLEQDQGELIFDIELFIIADDENVSKVADFKYSFYFLPRFIQSSSFLVLGSRVL